MMLDKIAQSPDYPIPRSAQEKQEKEPVEVPPVMLTSTASAHVFVAKIACEQADLHPAQLFADIDPSAPLPGTFYEFLKPSFKGNYPPSLDQPEVAFLGRSNVGKSSLINAMMRSKLAVTSKTPGRTQAEYYYGFIPSNTKLPDHNHRNNKQNSTFSPTQATGFLVDLPGYGFAAAPGDKVEGWQTATQDFLRKRFDVGTLRRVFLLQDARLEVPQNIDHLVQQWMDEHEIPYTVVLTKADDTTADGKRTPGIVKHANLNSMRFHNQLMMNADNDDDSSGGGTMSPFVHVTSSKKNTGIAELVTSVFAEFDSDGSEQRQQEFDYDYDDDDDAEEMARVQALEEAEYIYKGR